MTTVDGMIAGETTSWSIHDPAYPSHGAAPPVGNRPDPTGQDHQGDAMTPAATEPDHQGDAMAPIAIGPNHQADAMAPTATRPFNASQPTDGAQDGWIAQTDGNGLNGANGHHGGARPIEVLCGPLLNYKHMTDPQSSSPRWHGSVLLVAKPGKTPPELTLRHIGIPPGKSNARNGAAGAAPSVSGVPDGGHDETGRSTTSTAVPLYSDPVKTFWRMDLEIPLGTVEAMWEYRLENLSDGSGESSVVVTRTLVVPSQGQSMRVMFHSCNGFSVGTDVDAWSGPALWNDVLRVHEERPFHVMIGGGDQIYNDNVRVEGPLKEWTSIRSPQKRRAFPFDEDMRARCDDFYFKNYVRWFSTEPFATANGQIPQVNVWDDHDIIDGFGSYTDHFMRCPVFRGIGGVAEKYYLLFQHHVPPPVSTYTTDAPQTTATDGLKGMTGADPVQLKDTYVRQDLPEEPSWIMGNRPGPYVSERSRSIYTRLGKAMAFIGIDARMERTRHQINYEDTYEIIFGRLDRELAQAAGQVKHLLVLLGVPIAYPRLVWLENLLTSPLIGPIRFLNKRFGVAGNFFNHFDGQVDILDDLDDHYTARQHKSERKRLIKRLQALSQKHAVRITILSGDVHLAALGRFYSNPRLQIETEKDHRYMVNIISSAITNKPPPAAVANMLARRNKIHHLDPHTDETLLGMFERGPGGRPKAAASNHVTMPSRNYAILTETGVPDDDYHHHHSPSGSKVNGSVVNGIDDRDDTTTTVTATQPATGTREKFIVKDGHSPLHAGEVDAGTTHVAATGLHVRHHVPDEKSVGLDISIRVEIDPSDRFGHTEGYGLHSEFPFFPRPLFPFFLLFFKKENNFI